MENVVKVIKVSKVLSVSTIEGLSYICIVDDKGMKKDLLILDGFDYYFEYCIKGKEV